MDEEETLSPPHKGEFAYASWDNYIGGLDDEYYFESGYLDPELMDMVERDYVPRRGHEITIADYELDVHPETLMDDDIDDSQLVSDKLDEIKISEKELEDTVDRAKAFQEDDDKKFLVGGKEKKKEKDLADELELALEEDANSQMVNDLNRLSDIKSSVVKRYLTGGGTKSKKKLSSEQDPYTLGSLQTLEPVSEHNLYVRRYIEALSKLKK